MEQHSAGKTTDSSSMVRGKLIDLVEIGTGPNEIFAIEVTALFARQPFVVLRETFLKNEGEPRYGSFLIVPLESIPRILKALCKSSTEVERDVLGPVLSDQNEVLLEEYRKRRQDEVRRFSSQAKDVHHLLSLLDDSRQDHVS